MGCTSNITGDWIPYKMEFPIPPEGEFRKMMMEKWGAEWPEFPEPVKYLVADGGPSRDGILVQRLEGTKRSETIFVSRAQLEEFRWMWDTQHGDKRYDGSILWVIAMEILNREEMEETRKKITIMDLVAAQTRFYESEGL